QTRRLAYALRVTPAIALGHAHARRRAHADIDHEDDAHHLDGEAVDRAAVQRHERGDDEGEVERAPFRHVGDAGADTDLVLARELALRRGCGFPEPWRQPPDDYQKGAHHEEPRTRRRPC